MKKATPIFLSAALSLLCTGTVSAHDKTRPAFEAARNAAREKAQSVREKENRSTCRLTIGLSDAKTKQPLFGLVRVTRIEENEAWPLVDALERPMSWYALPARSTVNIPRTKVKIEAIHGMETDVTERVLDLTGKTEATVELPLVRFYDPEANGVRSGNTHVHLILEAHQKVSVYLRSRSEADQYLQTTSKADGLDLVYVSHLTRPGKTYITNDYTDDDFKRLSEGVLFANGEEYRHAGRNVDGKTSMSYGHVMFLDLTKLVLPVSLGPGLTPGGKATDNVPLRPGILEARRDGAGVIWCHGTRGLEDVPSLVTGLLDAQNIYDGGNDGTCSTVFYPYLNAGFRVPFSTGTDWGIYDFARVYVPLEGPVSSKGFLRALSAGKSYITNGTFLDFQVNDAKTGDTLALSKPGKVNVRGKAVGREDFTRIELVHNGEVIHAADSKPVASHFEAEMDFSMDVDEPGWLALRIPTDRVYEARSQYSGKGTNILGKALFAHTSPVYVELGGRKMFEPAAAERLISDMERSISMIQAKGIFDTAQERVRVLEIYREGIAVLRERLDEESESQAR